MVDPDILATIADLPVDLLTKTVIKEEGQRGLNQANIILALTPLLWPALQVGKITNALRVAHFLGQCAEESWQFSQLLEAGTGEEYEGRANLGNTRPGDGPLFKGRGIIQLTGRANYTLFSGYLDLPLDTQPDLAAQPAVALRVAVMYWTHHGLNVSADNDDLEQITRAINGGTNGLTERGQGVARVLAAMGWS